MSDPFPDRELSQLAALGSSGDLRVLCLAA